MRYIDLRRLVLPDGWEHKAQQALSEIELLPAHERSGAIEKKAKLWRDLKDTLKSASHGKCWYCESREVRSDCAVDHFRPKNAVAECPAHAGYWWLAFDWHNFRLSCTFCNSRRVDPTAGTGGGKQDHFPLIHEDRRAYKPDDDIGSEEPELLDPTDLYDVGLLWFEPDGRAVPKYGPDHPWVHQRAKCSVRLYHLDHVDLVEQRLAVCRAVGDLVKDAERFLTESLSGVATAKYGFKRVHETLRNMLCEEEEYSATARAALLGYRDRDWVDAVFAAL